MFTCRGTSLKKTHLPRSGACLYLPVTPVYPVGGECDGGRIHMSLAIKSSNTSSSSPMSGAVEGLAPTGVPRPSEAAPPPRTTIGP